MGRVPEIFGFGLFEVFFPNFFTIFEWGAKNVQFMFNSFFELDISCNRPITTTYGRVKYLTQATFAKQTAEIVKVLLWHIFYRISFFLQICITKLGHLFNAENWNEL